MVCCELVIPGRDTPTLLDLVEEPKPSQTSISSAREWLLHRDVGPRFPIFDESTCEGSANLK